MFEMYDKIPGLTEEKISALEKKYKVTLSQGYKAFLKEYNGGRPITGVFDFLDDDEDGSVIDSFLSDVSVRDSSSFAWTVQVFKGRYPKDFFPIASDAFGNLILLGITEEYFDQVYFWDHEMEHDPDQGEKLSMKNMTKVANSFEEFKSSLYEADYG